MPTQDETAVRAALAAVLAYLHSEEEELSRSCAEHLPEEPRAAAQRVSAAAVPPSGLWPSSGRLMGMQMRNLVQWRALRKL